MTAGIAHRERMHVVGEQQTVAGGHARRIAGVSEADIGLLDLRQPVGDRGIDPEPTHRHVVGERGPDPGDEGVVGVQHHSVGSLLGQ